MKRTAEMVATKVRAQEVAAFWTPDTISSSRKVWTEFGHEREIGARLDAIEILLADRAARIVELEEARTNVAVALDAIGSWTARLAEQVRR